jgi:hypothetical protein
VHLAFDLFPWAWQGYSLIHVPFYGRLGAQLSWVWVLGSVLGCLLMSSLLLRNIREFYLGLLGLVVMYGVSAAHEPGASFWALVVLLAAAFLAFVLPRRRMVSGGAGTKTGTDSFGPGWL